MILPSLVMAMLGLSTSGAAKKGPEIFVRADRSLPVERLAAAVRPLGFIESREKGTYCYLIQLNSGIDGEMAKQQLEKLPGVKALEPEEEPVDMNSIRSIDRKIAHMEAEGSEEKESGVDYLEAYRDFIFRRAYPNDRFDWSSIARAREHALQMPATKFPKMPAHANSIVTGLQSWEFMGPTNLQVPPNAICFGVGAVNGRINAVAYDPTNSQIIYAGGADGGLWKSKNGGTTWSWLSASWPQLPVNCIAIDPNKAATIYVGMGDYQGQKALAFDILKSTDAGATWQLIGAHDFGAIGVDSIWIDPTNSQTLLAGTGDNRYPGFLEKSTDGGASWNVVLGGNNNDQCEFPSIAMSATQNGSFRLWTVEGGQAGNSNSRIFYSDDHGTTWNQSPSTITGNNGFYYAYQVATSPTNPQTVYVLDSQNQRLVYSTDNGALWTEVSSNLPFDGPNEPSNVGPHYNFSQSNYDYHMECGNRVTNGKNTDVLYLGEIDIQESVDQGHSWTSLGGPSWQTIAQGAITHNDQHCLTVCPSNPNVCLFGNDGGVYQLSYDPNTSKNTITSLNQTLGTTMFTFIACHPTLPNYVMGGTQDNGTPFATGDLNNWSDVMMADGGGCAINQVNPLISYATWEHLTMHRTSDGWNTNTDISPQVPKGEVLPFSPRVVLAPSDQSKLYTATNNLWMYNDNTQQWSEAFSNNPNSIFALAVAPTNPDCIYTGTVGNAIGYAPNGLPSFGSILAPLPNGVVTSISVSPSNQNDIVIGYSNPGGGQVMYRCTNTSTIGFTIWTNVSGVGNTGLPATSINSIARDLDDPENTWYVATDAGIFQTSDAGNTWTNASASYGLPNVIITDLVAVPGTRYLNAGTYGRGMWRMYLPPAGAALDGLSVSPSSVAGGTTATGTIALTKAAPAGGVTIPLTSNGAIGIPASVTVPAGASSTTFPVTTTASNTTVNATVTATQVSIVWTAPLIVEAPALTNMTFTQDPIVGGTTAFGQVSVSGVAPTGGTTVTLSSSSTSINVPASIVIPAGQSVGYFQVSTQVLTSNYKGTITATANGTTTTGSVSVVPATLQALTLSNGSVVGGSTATITGTLTFSGPTPAAGVKVSLVSSDAAAVTVPASIIAKTTTSPYSVTFTVTHKQVKAAQNVTITATSVGASAKPTLQVLPFQVAGLTLAPDVVVGGQSSVGTVTLNATPAASTGSIKVGLDHTGASITLPRTIAVSAGKQTGTFSVTAGTVKTESEATITAVLNGSNAPATLTIVEPTLASFSLKPTSVQGSSRTTVTGTVTLTGPAPSGGMTITLASADKLVAPVPATVTIAAGKMTGTFTVGHARVASSVTVNLAASLGDTTKTATLTVTH